MQNPLPPLRREQLDAKRCHTPGCDHMAHEALVLRAACCSTGQMHVEYKTGVLAIRCGKCGRFVADIAVAP